MLWLNLKGKVKGKVKIHNRGVVELWLYTFVILWLDGLGSERQPRPH